IANDIGFDTIYGDTDSLFVNNVKMMENAQKFINECNSMLGVGVGHEKTFSELILVGKKHYIGILPDPTKEPTIKGMEVIRQQTNLKRWKRSVSYGYRWIAETAFSSIKRTFGEQ